MSAPLQTFITYARADEEHKHQLLRIRSAAALPMAQKFIINE